MKKWLMAAMVLLVAASVNAQQRQIPKVSTLPYGTIVMDAVWSHTMVAADTQANKGYKDTVYSAWFEMPFMPTLHFATYLDGKHSLQNLGKKDSAFAKDTIFVAVQSSVDGEVVATTATALGTVEFKSADLDTQVAYKAVAARDSALGCYPYIRAMFIIQDTTATTRPSVFGNTYMRLLRLFLIAK